MLSIKHFISYFYIFGTFFGVFDFVYNDQQQQVLQTRFLQCYSNLVMFVMITVMPYSQFKFLKYYVSQVDDESNLTSITSLIEFIAMFVLYIVMFFKIIFNRNKIRATVNNGIILFNSNILDDKRIQQNCCKLFCKIILFELTSIGFFIFISLQDHKLNQGYYGLIIQILITVSIFVSNIFFATLMHITAIIDVFNENIGIHLVEINSKYLTNIQIKMRINKINLIIQKYRKVQLFVFEVIAKFELFYIFFVLFAFITAATEVNCIVVIKFYSN